MVAINTQSLRGVQQIQGSFDDNTSADTAGEEAEAWALTISDHSNEVDWEYSAIAEDNTTNIHSPGEATPPSELDLQPGLLYKGPSGVDAQVMVTEFNLAEGGAGDAEEGDGVNLAVYLNSTPMLESDEGLSRDFDTETPVEFNLRGTVHNIQENDVLRFGIYGTSEETLDWDNEEASGEWSVS